MNPLELQQELVGFPQICSEHLFDNGHSLIERTKQWLLVPMQINATQQRAILCLRFSEGLPPGQVVVYAVVEGMMPSLVPNLLFFKLGFGSDTVEQLQQLFVLPDQFLGYRFLLGEDFTQTA